MLAKTTVRFRSKRASGGFTFVEVLVAVTLLIIGFLGIYATMFSSALLRETANETNIAIFKLQATTEYIFSLPFDDITDVFPDGAPVNVSPFLDNNPDNNFLLSNESVAVTYPDPGTSDPLQFVVTITWTSRMGTDRDEHISCARSR